MQYALQYTCVYYEDNDPNYELFENHTEIDINIYFENVSVYFQGVLKKNNTLQLT